MRKLAMAGVLAAAALFARDARADDAAKERREAADATRAEMRQDSREARGEMREAGREMKQEGREARDAMRSDADRRQPAARTAAAARQDKKHPLFDGKNNFDIEGKVQKVSKSSITVSREELPAATLSLSQHTKIELDGDQVAASQLKPGQDVKASFNLRGDKAEAVEIKAEKTEGQEKAEERREEQREQMQERREERREQQQK